MGWVLLYSIGLGQIRLGGARGLFFFPLRWVKEDCELGYV